LKEGEMTMRKGYADCSSGQLHFRHIAGEGVPAIFIHQSGSSSQMWIKVMDRLAGTRPLYAFDLPGYGGSFDPPHEDNPTMPQYGAWVSEAIADLGIDRFHVIGHHTGACVAVEIAAAQPDAVQTISLIGPVPLTAEERLEFSKHFGHPFTPVVSGSYLLENWDYLRNLGAHADPMLMHRELTDMLRAWWGRVQSYDAVWDQDFLSLYKALSMPVCIGAAEDDVLYPFIERARELQPEATLLSLTGANFEPDLGAESVASGLEAFLAANG
jgi:pimeloyl-ACP methyl ester carboxylesterase